MGDKTGISWTDATWNCVRGCSRVSEGCRHCYAETIAARFSGKGQPYEGLATRKLKVISDDDQRVESHWTGKISFVGQHLMDPFRWRAQRRIFTNSMSDLFHPKVEDWMIDKILAVMLICCDHESRGGHTFQTLTKRPQRMCDYLSDPKTLGRVALAAAQLMEDGDGWLDAIEARKGGFVDPKIWWGVSVEDQEAADARIPMLLETPAAVRFLSCEPLLGPVNISEYFDPCSVACGEEPWPDLHWVITGCESGRGARPCDVAWLRSLRDQCEQAGVPFFLKQAVVATEAHYSASGDAARYEPVVMMGSGAKRKSGGVIELPYLDGVQHAAFPEPRP